MKSSSILFIALLFLISCREDETGIHKSVIGPGQMPNVARDNEGKMHIVYGKDESIMYSISSDQGHSFSSPVEVGRILDLAASHMRGPQLASTSTGLVLICCNGAGDIFSFVKDQAGAWQKSTRVNDVDEVAKEGLMALSADGALAFAIWQDMRNGQNEIFGARSIDGGKSWEKNMLVYASPDGSTCECCKPSVLVKGNKVYVMFRNWIKGNRDMYIIESTDEGHSFGQAEKIGSGSWALNGCPMDGGSFTVRDDGAIETVWRRKSQIYAAEKGKEEKKIGEGKSCTLETVNGKNVFAWTENGDVIVLKPQGMKKNLGEGSMPVLKALNNEHVICIWENDNKIYSSVLEL